MNKSWNVSDRTYMMISLLFGVIFLFLSQIASDTSAQKFGKIQNIFNVFGTILFGIFLYFILELLLRAFKLVNRTFPKLKTYYRWSIVIGLELVLLLAILIVPPR